MIRSWVGFCHDAFCFGDYKSRLLHKSGLSLHIAWVLLNTHAFYLLYKIAKLCCFHNTVFCRILKRSWHPLGLVYTQNGCFISGIHCTSLRCGQHEWGLLLLLNNRPPLPSYVMSFCALLQFISSFSVFEDDS